MLNLFKCFLNNNWIFIEVLRLKEISNTFKGGTESVSFLSGKCTFPCSSCVECGTWTYLCISQSLLPPTMARNT